MTDCLVSAVSVIAANITTDRQTDRQTGCSVLRYVTASRIIT